MFCRYRYLLLDATNSSPRELTGKSVHADGPPGAPFVVLPPLIEQLVAGPVKHPRHQAAPPVGAVPLLRVTLRDVAVGGQLNVDDVVQVHLHVRERTAGGADVAFVVRPAGLVLVAAHRYVAEEDMAVFPQARHVEELVMIKRHRSILRQVREEGACVLPADGHDLMVTVVTDNALR